MKPKAVRIEVRQFGQGVIAAVVIETGQSTPFFEPPPQRAHGSLQFGPKLGQSDHLFPSPKGQERRSGITKCFHSRKEREANGTAYVNLFIMHIVCHTNQKSATEKPMILREPKTWSYPPQAFHQHMLGQLRR